MKRIAPILLTLVFLVIPISHAYAVEIPSGVYTVGEDIPAGVYSVAGADKFDQALFHLWGRAAGDYSTNGGSIYQAWVGPGDSGKIGKITLEEGNVIEINGAIIVEPYKGFSFGEEEPQETVNDVSIQNDKTEGTENVPEDQSKDASADNVRKSGLYTYSIKGNGTVSIIDYDWGNSTGDIYIPSMLDGYTVTAINDEAFAHGKANNKTGVLVVIPNTITMIGEKAFFESPVSTMSIPVSVQSIGTAAFAYCDLTQFIVDQNQPYYATVDGVLYDKRNKALLAHPQNKTIDSKIPEGILSIGEYAFSGMTIGQTNDTGFCLTDILPSSLISIEPHAFEGCTLYYSFSNDNQSGIITDVPPEKKLVLFPDRLASIGEYAFNGCRFKRSGHSAPETIVIANNLEEIGDYAFNECDFFDGFDYDLLISANRMSRIGKSAFASAVMSSFGNTRMKVRINFPVEIEEVGEDAFFETYPVCIAEGTEIRSLGASAFCNTVVYSETKKENFQNETPYLLSITGAIKTIPSLAFANNSDNSLDTIESIILDEGITRIEESAFTNHSYLQTVTLPTTLTEIGDNAFSGCQSLMELSLPESVKKIGDDAFEKHYITLIVKEGSYAALWASENGYNYRYEGSEDSLDWLNSDIH